MSAPIKESAAYSTNGEQTAEPKETRSEGDQTYTPSVANVPVSAVSMPALPDNAALQRELERRDGAGPLMNELTYTAREREILADATELVERYTSGSVELTNAVMLAHALTYTARGFEVFPLSLWHDADGNGHLTPFRKAHKDPIVQRECKGTCGLVGHGHHDATSDIGTVCGWWTGEYNFTNIGLRPPSWCFVIDIDPRVDGCEDTWAALVAGHRGLPETMTQYSGRGDGGRHLFWRMPTGLPLAKALAPGLDIKGNHGYVVGAPSWHRITNEPYTEPVPRGIADAPPWLLTLVAQKGKARPAAVPPMNASARFLSALGGVPRYGQSPADAFNETATWEQVLMPHGWACNSPDGDADGSEWVRPGAESNRSASVTDGRLYVFSTATEFDPVGYGGPNGYSKFDAFATLNHNGDFKAAAAAIRK